MLSDWHVIAIEILGVLQVVNAHPATLVLSLAPRLAPLPSDTLALVPRPRHLSPLTPVTSRRSPFAVRPSPPNLSPLAPLTSRPSAP